MCVVATVENIAVQNYAVQSTITTFRCSTHMFITLVLVRIAKIIATPISKIFHFHKKNVKSNLSRTEKVFCAFDGDEKCDRRSVFHRRGTESGRKKLELVKIEQRNIDRVGWIKMFPVQFGR